MAIEIKVPDIGADEVEITEILVKVGDKVEAEQSLITVEGDKSLYGSSVSAGGYR
ncbi:dihydrolipoamide acetyltransferase component (E2) of pyruvate dehydrogenase [Escherichia coli]|uniref:Dihydrolipoamide acetyltransferase component (E2) of pyruvate dehydrogenase n=1 Tax=Escherichia coli TaxID=562 RepID=A0A447Y2J2_ECOLX|nr:dihydrolipoamide acetyltransferase component (E2) of pyruvate dehydrogenase [Escherichia coli]